MRVSFAGLQGLQLGAQGREGVVVGAAGVSMVLYAGQMQKHHNVYADMSTCTYA